MSETSRDRNPDPSESPDVYARVASTAAARPGAPSSAGTDPQVEATPSWKERLAGVGTKLAGRGEDAPTSAASTAGSRVAPTSTATPASTPEPTVPVAVPATGASSTTTTDVAVEPVEPVKPKPKPGVARRTRKARLRLSRLDPWSVMKTGFLFSFAAGIMLCVAVYAIWSVISASGLFDNVNQLVGLLVSTPGDTTPFRLEDYVSTPKVMGVTAFLACVDVVIFTALATLGSFLYNLAATLIGGLEVTLAED